ncbi:MAG: histidinol-phosphate transaminase [Thermodesulfobacteriota bacterium]
MKTKDKKTNLVVPEHIRSIVPYPPGKPLAELERELGISGSIKLASNENPLGPSPKAVEALRGELGGLNRYPDGSCYYLKRKLSERLDVDPEWIVPGNGSNEVIELLVRAFLPYGAEAVMGEPSFAVYPLAVKAAGGLSVRVPLKDMRHDLEAMSRAINERTRIVFIANPNNPTGTIVSAGQLDAFMERVPEGVIVCIDEAYYEYVQSGDFPDSLKYIREGRPVILLRTFSKIYGLSGLRVGYGVARPEITDFLNRVRQPFNVNSLAQSAALSALDDTEHIRKSVENNKSGLDYLFTEIKAMGLGAVPTEANFFLIKVGEGKKVYERLLRLGVIVRPMGSYGLDEYIRVTVGLPEENKRFVTALREAVR